MALTYDIAAQFSKVSDYFKALKKEKSYLHNKGEFLLIIINYKGKMEKKTTLMLPFQKEADAKKEFVALKNKAVKDIKKNQIAFGTYTINKETGELLFEITKGQAGPKKINSKAPKVCKSIFNLSLVASLSANYDGEGEILDDAEELEDPENDAPLPIIENENPELESENDNPPIVKPEIPTKLDPQLNTLAVSINKGIKQLSEKTAADTKAVVAQLLAEIPTFLQLAETNAAVLTKQLSDFVPIAENYLKKIEKATTPTEPKEKAPLSDNQKKARQLNSEINSLVQQIQALEKANAAKKK